jgi:hypothetical protein
VNAHSSINDSVFSFKSNSKKTKRVDSETSLLGYELPKEKDLLLNTTYNQILNLTYEELATFEYVFIDECHALTNDMSFRSETIADLIFHLIEFVVKYPDAKTKIIFMSGTPNVETLVIPEIMKEYAIAHLFQKVLVKKEYAISPTLNLVHLDTTDKTKRTNAVMRQIKGYITEGRKLVCVFNNKEKMADLHRDIQTKLGKEIKVGLFYSGSTGICTQNILSSKIGDFDVVLTTNYFVNGININKDGLTEADVKAGKTSTQKYGMVIDLGSKYSNISAIDTIQATNRFRNRLCETTVFFSKIFKPDEEQPSRKFQYNHATKTLLGISRYNFHLLSQNENVVPNQISEEVVEVENIHFVNEFRKNPLSISLNDISTKSKREEHKIKVENMINKEARIYEDWFYSMDGYRYLAKDAGFNTILKHIELGEDLKGMSEDQIELENKIIKTLVVNEKGIYKLISSLDKECRIHIQASSKITDPVSIKISHFSIVEQQKNLCTIEGDFHSSHERSINKLFRCYFKLKYYYDHQKALEIITNLINPAVDFTPLQEKSFLKNIANYVRSCNNIEKDKYLKALNYVLSLDYLAEKNLGIFKVEKATWTSYTITDPKLVGIIKDNWIQQQFDLITYKLNAVTQKNDWSMSDSQRRKSNPKKAYFIKLYGNPKKEYILESEKDTYLECFSNKELIKSYDLEDLENQLKLISNYCPLRYTKEGKLKNLETIIIPKIIGSSKLLNPLEIEKDDYSEPEQLTIKDVDLELDNLLAIISGKIDKHIPSIIRKNNPHLERLYCHAMNWLKNKDIFSLLEHVKDLVEDPRSEYRPGLLPILKKIQFDLSTINQVFLKVFKASEYKTYNNLTKYKVSPFKKELFLCDKKFNFESLLPESNSGLVNVNKNDIYDSLIQNSKLYKNTKNIRPRSNSGSRKIVNSTSNYSVEAYILLNENKELLYADFSKSKFCAFLCDYAYKHEGFRFKNGITPIKNDGKGIYNPSNFRKNYLSNNSKNKSLDNYKIEFYDINVKDYVDYNNSL